MIEIMRAYLGGVDSEAIAEIARQCRIAEYSEGGRKHRYLIGPDGIPPAVEKLSDGRTAVFLGTDPPTVWVIRPNSQNANSTK